MISSSRPSTGNKVSMYLGVRGSRGLPPRPPTVPPNSGQVRNEADVADQIVLKDSLQRAQSAAVIGNTVPLVFCREVSGVGGVLVSPPCVRAGFQVTAAGTVAANYLCVLSDGQLASVALADVWHGGRKLNTLSNYSYGQGYEVIPAEVALVSYFENGDDALKYPLSTGGGGSMKGLTLLGVRAVYQPAEASGWNQQVHAFVRSGFPVTRLIDNTLGPSNNFADLCKLLIASSGRVPESLIDNASLLTAARFTNAEGLFFNGVLSTSTGLRDFLARVAPLFLLTVSSINGKTGLLPSLPINGSFGINTGVIMPVASYGLEDIIQGSYKHQFVPQAERQFFRAVMNWREQPADDASVVRSVVVGYEGYAVDGPFETYDLSDFCVTESHAIKVGRFIVAQRRYVTHTVEFSLRPECAHHEPGDIIRVNINRIPSADENLVFSRLYMVTGVVEDPAGAVQITATHFPVDNTGRSLVAKEISGAALIQPDGGQDQCPPPPPVVEPNDPDAPGATGYIVAFGGTVTEDGDYKIHTFTGNNSFVVANAPEGQTVEYLIVGGGGGGGQTYPAGYSDLFVGINPDERAGGGGGGGGVRSGTFTPTPTGYSVAVGNGAIGESRGGDSSIFGITAIGGGAGLRWSSNGPVAFNNGGSGGGSPLSSVTAGLGTAGQGNAGGLGGSANGKGGGGGGAGAPGGAASTTGGAGGAGVSSSITGSPIVYGGGGGGAAQYGNGGIAGNGGGGAGAGGVAFTGDNFVGSGTFIPPGDGINGRGGGGGGGSNSIVGKGGSGVVIVRYRFK